jgi:hypothetical protein
LPAIDLQIDRVFANFGGGFAGSESRNATRHCPFRAKNSPPEFESNFGITIFHLHPRTSASPDARLPRFAQTDGRPMAHCGCAISASNAATHQTSSDVQLPRILRRGIAEREISGCMSGPRGLTNRF